jgi:hypothetical protein
MDKMNVKLTLDISRVAGCLNAASDIFNEGLGSANALDVHQAAGLGDGSGGASLLEADIRD